MSEKNLWYFWFACFCQNYNDHLSYTVIPWPDADMLKELWRIDVAWSKRNQLLFSKVPNCLTLLWTLNLTFSKAISMFCRIFNIHVKQFQMQILNACKNANRKKKKQPKPQNSTNICHFQLKWNKVPRHAHSERKDLEENE